MPRVAGVSGRIFVVDYKTLCVVTGKIVFANPDCTKRVILLGWPSSSYSKNSRLRLYDDIKRLFIVEEHII